MGKIKSLLILILCIFISDCLNSENVAIKKKIPKHHLPNGSFQNNYIGSADKSFFDLIKWKFEAETPDPITFPLARNDPYYLKHNQTKSTLTWIGHATFLIQYNGKNILTDPHLSDRASPLGFIGPKRYTPPGLSINELPQIDFVLISHNHYDSLDQFTIESLYERQKENPPLFFVPLKLKDWFLDLGIKSVIELDWWEYQILKGWKIYAVPVQHFSGRTLWDRNKTLWCGWVLENSNARIFFAGDSGYSKDFIDIGEFFGYMDLSLIPIGAYEPRWFMKEVHVNPEEAVRIHNDVNSSLSVGMHWGTFQLTDEPMDEPPIRLKDARNSAGINKDQFFVMQHGETKNLNL